jgi:hypothetical protein
MTPEAAKEAIQKLLQEAKQATKQIAKDLSTARLLAENEPIGDLVILSLLDDGRVTSDLWAHLKIISDWLKKAEELYKLQFPEGFPMKDARYDLNERQPSMFKSRFDIFKERVEEWEANELWSAEVILNDPLTVIKKMRKDPPQG